MLTTPFPTTLEEEKLELHSLLSSGLLSRAPNLQHFLEYVCEQYFSGRSDGLKEYTIAVNALHRPSTFNPQIDTIVRVTAHALRKRLEHYYSTDAAHHRVRIILPSGQYLPRFLHMEAISPEAVPTASELHPAAVFEEVPAPLAADLAAVTEAIEPYTPPAPVETSPSLFPETSVPATAPRPTYYFWPLAIAVAALLAMVAAMHAWRKPHAEGSTPALATHASAKAPGSLSAAASATAIRFLPGANRASLTDAAGQPWAEDRFCTGGSSFSRPDHVIGNVGDNALYTSGRAGRFQCRIPAVPGTYELHLFFADTAGGRVAARQVVYYINGGTAQALDVVDDAGGTDTATEKILTGIRPEADGTIHLDFTADDSFSNAIEVLPATSPAMLPFRMTVGPNAIKDLHGNLWLPERFFFAGRRSSHTELPKVQDGQLFQWERFGNMRYTLPVVPGRTYSVRLYFSEGWFGTANSGNGGVGSRIFDVYCNGATLLHNFDISAEQKNGVVIRTFHGIPATAGGKLEIALVPVINYPLVNAIEVTEDTSD